MSQRSNQPVPPVPKRPLPQVPQQSASFSNASASAVNNLQKVVGNQATMSQRSNQPVPPVPKRPLPQVPQQSASFSNASASAVNNLQKVVGNQATSKIVSSQLATNPRQKGNSKVKELGPNAKVMAALEVFATKVDPDTVAVGANIFAMANTPKVDNKELGHGVKGSGSATSSVQTGAWASASAQELANAYVTLIEAKVITGGSLKLEGELKRQFGDYEGAIRGKLEAFTGAVAQAKGHAKLQKNNKGRITGFDVGGETNAFAGVKSEQKMEVQFGAETLGASANLSSTQMIGANATASGVIALSKNDIAVNGEVSAFAGLKAEGTVGGGVKLFGRDMLTGSVTGTASLGVGVEGHGRFQLRRGVLALALHGHAALGVGHGVGVDTALDFKPLAVWVYRKIDEQYWALNPERATAVLNSFYLKYVLKEKLREYAKAKQEAIRADKADNYVKLERVQQLIGNVLPVQKVEKHPNAATIDNTIKKAIEECFLATQGAKVVATVKNGNVVKIEGLITPAEIRATSHARSMELNKRGITQGLDDIASSSNINVGSTTGG